MMRALFRAVLFVGVVVAPALSGQTAVPALERVAGGVTLRIDALRADVLRVRVYKGVRPEDAPEDASWAVLPGARTASVAVTKTAGGFETSAVKVEVASDLRVTVSDLSGHVLQQDAAPVEWGAQGFRVTQVKTPEDHYFGLGDKTGPLDRAGQSFVMWNTDAFGFQESTDPIYKSIPFFMQMRGGRALGVFFDNTFRTFFDFGHQQPGIFRYTAPGGPLDYYVMVGPEPKQVLSAYAWLTGTTPLPPMWSLGYQQSRYTYFPESQVEEIAKRLRADRIPADAIWLDIDYQLKNRPFTVDTEHYPDFAGMIHRMSAERLHTVLITDLHIAHLPHAGYAPYDSGEAGDHFVKMPDGEEYVGPVWPGPSVFPDFTRQVTRAWWGSLYKDFVAMGASGFWNDMNEPAVFVSPSKTMPDEVQHRIDEPGFQKRTVNHTEAHNFYGMQNTRATYDGLIALDPKTRPFVLTRASYAGGQRYSATWTGDNSATWNHLKLMTPQLLNLGLSGFSFSGADVGGFAGSPSPALLTKWIEIAAFQPIDRNHSAKGTRPHEPWVDGPDQEAIRRRYIEERYRLMPYLYTLAEETSRDGVPMVRPLFVEFPHASADGHPIDLDTGGGEFMLGGSLLIAPNPSPEEVAPYEVHLPPGTWFDYWTGERFERATRVQARDLEQRDALLQAKPLQIVPKLETLPVYVRGGSILPVSPLVQSTEETPQGPLTLRVYVPLGMGMACGGEIYADDGKSFAYRSGSYARIAMTCGLQADGSLTVSVAPQQGSYVPWWKQYRVEVYGWSAAKGTAQMQGGMTKVQRSGAFWSTTLAADSRGFSVTLR